MDSTKSPLLTVSDFIAIANQTLEYSFPTVLIEGEVSSFKVNQNKYVFFDIKDKTGSVGCFMTVWQLRQPIEDGMKVVVSASPKLTAWGKFSLTVNEIRPSGEGSLKRSFDLLKAKLEKEGLFDQSRKRLLPQIPLRVAVISSVQAAGYADFIKIINDRWGGLVIDVANVRVQGGEAPDQIIKALKYFNSTKVSPELVVIIRGGGSADDLSAFNDEQLVREIAVSRVPVMTGIGHETDLTLADLVADARASTPSNAAQLIVPDRGSVIDQSSQKVHVISLRANHLIENRCRQARDAASSIEGSLHSRLLEHEKSLKYRDRVLAELDPEKVLSRGYAIISGDIKEGSKVSIVNSDLTAVAEVVDVSKR